MNEYNDDIKFGFVILHYLAFDITKKSIESILRIGKGQSIKIVVVDNASNNQSGNRLKDYFKSFEEVEVLINSSNQGFARGNNIGYSYLRKQNKFDFIIIMNNDVIIEDITFLNTIVELYKEYKFDILGPDIYSPLADIHQNPVSLKSEFDLIHLQKRIRQLEKINQNFYVNHRVDTIVGKIKYWVKRIILPKSKEERNYSQMIENPLLHGACYIFSEKFINYNSTAFNDGTFLYFEEDILYYESIKKGRRMIYSPKLQVLHMEDIATNMAYGNSTEKLKMKSEEQLKSARVFEKILLEDNRLMR